MADRIAADLEKHRAELVAHCRRMLGSTAEAEDAVQDTMIRAWHSYDRFLGRSTVRTWLYRIATNVCLNMLRARQRRPCPVGGTGERDAPPEVGVAPPGADLADPADQVVDRDEVRLAFAAALLHLSPRQRSALLLCEVLRWPASDVAELLGTSVAAVNSALQRARATLAELSLPQATPTPTPPSRSERSQRSVAPQPDPAQLRRFTDAFVRYDLDALVGLLRRPGPAPVSVDPERSGTSSLLPRSSSTSGARPATV
jgi:RNA polymerase sigma-70 factor (ECF subfamily)